MSNPETPGHPATFYARLSPRKSMSSQAEKALLAAIFTQLDVSNLDYDKLAKSLKLPTQMAARNRWNRFVRTLSESTPNTHPSGGKKLEFVPRTTHGSPTKKAKIELDDDDEEEEEELGKESKDKDMDKDMDKDKVGKRIWDDTVPIFFK